MTIDPARSTAADTPVFLDASGRRHRIVRAVGWVLAAIVLAYMVMLGISLTASPGFLPFSFGGVKILPNAAAPKIPSTRTPARPTEPPSSPAVNGPAPTPATARHGTNHPTPAPSNGAGRPGSSTAHPGTPPPHPESSGKPSGHPTPTHSSRTGTPSAHPTPTHSSRTGTPSAHPTPTRTSHGGN